jgi:hypothetical protein
VTVARNEREDFMSCMFPCPVCGGDSLHLHVWKDDWCICERCRVKWWAGYGLVSWPFSWEELEAATERNLEELRRYTLVGHDE